ncbi:diiron oxygenase [Mycolicibacterium sp. S2-37]|uniref:AurF N-oxygenase family protein n=1 Tax=Mycolicibacterium sp. S2-37 TaxID=2810297 RepID=UPI001A9445F6|nr:diiron oxygenase [Mycolicibacterium sp. S2-37]MBO0678703.1 diiron oxygenase [Mycolicibacterium sp. S2-37]
MVSSAKAAASPSREDFSDRLLRGSAKKSYAPVVDIDWEAPVDPDRFFLPPEVVSLYGTPMWAEMTRAQQIELSRQEFINLLSAGIWFENILNQALLRGLMHADPTSAATHYSLTELGDETRHMVMFGRAIGYVDGKPFRPKRYQRMIINTLPLTFRGSVLWVAALVGEEIFDALQRQILDDPELQPIVRRVMRIHVTEEARHIQFARDGARRAVPEMRAVNRLLLGTVHGAGGPFYRYLFTNPATYRRAGLDGREARRQARANPHFREAQRLGFAPLAEFLQEVGLMSRLGRWMWRRSNFL